LENGRPPRRKPANAMQQQEGSAPRTNRSNSPGS